MHVARSGNSSGDERPAPGDYRTRCPEGGKIMPEVSWTPDKYKGGVSGLVELFRTTFVFGINSSGRFLPAPGIIDRQPGGGMLMLGKLEGVVGIRIVYSYSLYFSDEFSCINFFDPSYGLKDIDFQIFKTFKRFSGIILLIKYKHYQK